MSTSPRGSEAVRSPLETIACSRGYRLEQRPSAGADARAQGTGGLGLGLSEMGDTQKGHGTNLPHVLPAASPPRASLCLAPCSPIPFTCRPFSRALLCGSPGSGLLATEEKMGLTPCLGSRGARPPLSRLPPHCPVLPFPSGLGALGEGLPGHASTQTGSRVQGRVLSTEALEPHQTGFPGQLFH